MPLLFFGLWMVLSGTWSWENCLLGMVVSAGLTAAERKIAGYRFHRPSLRRFLGNLSYFFLLIREILIAAFRMLPLIWGRRGQPDSRMISFDSGLKTPQARAALANSITLTAGTIAVSVEESRLYIHALDRSLAEGIESGPLVCRLRKMEEEG